ncbi:hypothetical protein [Mycoplasma todarodis]|uniref:Lipoprotein n=1 Tax=Mycoplasma todarodis TaxID=1937191 RepID=A0A4R0XM76_9MOLU|nr:hypothetical protein [Mycoplasma todarodis]TCG11810.1 hypothetical protein C4B25_00635 [Mycoplasma todarodis]
MNKKTKKISLGVVTALTTVAVPVATVISCGKKDEAKKDEAKKVEKHASEKITAKVNFDQVLKEAKVKSTDQNIKNGLVKKGHFDKNHNLMVDGTGSTTYFDTKSTKYVDPLNAVIAGTVEELLKSIAKDVPSMKPILEKLQKNDGIYKIAKDIMHGALDVEIFEKTMVGKMSINKMLTGGKDGLMMVMPTIQKTPDQFILTILDSVWKETKADLEKTGITVGEIGTLLKEIDGKKMSISMTVDGKEYTLLKETKVELNSPIAQLIKGMFSPNSKLLLSNKIESLQTMIHTMLPKLLKLPKKPLGEIIMGAVGKLMSGQSGTPAPTTSSKNLYTAAPKKDLMEVLEIITNSIARIALKKTTPIEASEKVTVADIEGLMDQLPIPKEIKEFVKPIVSIFTKVAELYQA